MTMQKTINNLALMGDTHPDLTQALADQLAPLVSMLEDVLVTHVYGTEDEAWDSPESIELVRARELLRKLRNGTRDFTEHVD